MPLIADFDYTITINHTFRLSQRLIINNEPGYANSGRKDAQSNTKKDIARMFEHANNDVCGIATFHNNPDYVSGYVSFILGKKLELSHITHLPTNPDVAIAHYKVEGSSQPFLISFVDAIGPDFKKAVENLENKNIQINFLRQTWIEQGLCARNDTIAFYDDDRNNYEAAAGLDYVDSYLVAPGKEFRITSEQVEDGCPSDLTPEQIQLEKRLVTLREKITSLRENGYIKAADEAEKLYVSLFNAFDFYLYDVDCDNARFKVICNQAIDEAHKELDQHRGWKNFLSNLALFIFGLGVGFVIKEIVNVVTNRPFLFYTQTDSSQMLDDISEDVKAIAPAI